MKHLFKQGFISLLLIIAAVICQAQPHSNYFQDFVIAHHKIYVFHADGIIKIFDDVSGKLLDTYSPNPKVKLLMQDHNGEVIIADSTNEVRRLDAENKWIPIASCKEDRLYRVVFNNDNECLLITNKGILSVKANKTYFPENKLYRSERALSGGKAWESADDEISTYVDNDNNLWIAFGHGEWGTDTFIWNTKDFNFISLNDWFVMPGYESNGHLFARTWNFFEEHLVQMDKVYDQNKKLIKINSVEVYNTKDDSTYQKAKHVHDIPNGDMKKFSEPGLYDFYVGGFTFKPSDGKFYVITSEGLLTSSHITRSTKFGDLKPTKYFSFPKNITIGYEYYSHQKHEVKFQNWYPQSISKIEFNSNGDLVMLAPWNGVWLFDWKKLVIVE